MIQPAEKLPQDYAIAAQGESGALWQTAVSITTVIPGRRAAASPESMPTGLWNLDSGRRPFGRPRNDSEFLVRASRRQAALVVLFARPRDAAQRLGGVRLLLRQVAERDDTDEALLAVHHRQTPHLDVGHVLADVRSFFILEAVHDLPRHRLAHLGVGPLALGTGADRGIAVGDSAGQMVAVGHRQHTAIAFLHQLRRMAQRVVRAGELRIAAHHVANLHLEPPFRSWTPRRLG